MASTLKYGLAAIAILGVSACGAANDAPVNEQYSVQVEEAGSMTIAQADALYGEILTKYISEKDGINFFGYGEVTAEDKANLKTYIAALEATGVDGMSEEEEMAFWFNLYNAKTIDLILDAYPVKTIKSLGSFNRGPWKKKVLNVAGIGEMSLDDIEHGTLRANWDEPRIHYGVNCASYGCPNLAATPWNADTLEEDLDTAAAAYINHPRGIRVENGKVIASSIYNWFQEDFDGSAEGVLDHAREYATGDLADALADATKISKYEYDWGLNEG
ncbi:MAG: DUF547 domain-containing protein [Pseudomonadota bacterium]